MLLRISVALLTLTSVLTDSVQLDKHRLKMFPETNSTVEETKNIARNGVLKFNMTADSSTLTADSSTLTADSSTLTADSSTLTADSSTLTADSSTLKSENTTETELNTALMTHKSEPSDDTPEDKQLLEYLTYINVMPAVVTQLMQILGAGTCINNNNHDNKSNKE